MSTTPMKSPTFVLLELLVCDGTALSLTCEQTASNIRQRERGNQLHCRHCQHAVLRACENVIPLSIDRPAKLLREKKSK
jgi:hypothetical protein